MLTALDPTEQLASGWSRRAFQAIFDDDLFVSSRVYSENSSALSEPDLGIFCF
jgi:hypothetical protein